jgi:hypothetical protein
VSAAAGQPAAAAIPPNAFIFDWLSHVDHVALDSLQQLDVVRCIGSRDARMRGHLTGTTRGFMVRSDPRGVWLEQVRGGKRATRFVSWEGVTRVDCRESRPRTRREGWVIGSAIGLTVGVVVMLSSTDPPGDLGDIVYPLAVAIGALPFGLAGGLVGMLHPGTDTGWASCWP